MAAAYRQTSGQDSCGLTGCSCENCWPEYEAFSDRRTAELDTRDTKKGPTETLSSVASIEATPEEKFDERKEQSEARTHLDHAVNCS